MAKIFGPANYKEIEVGDLLNDCHFGINWRAVKKNGDTVTIQCMSGGEDGVNMNVDEESSHLFFKKFDKVCPECGKPIYYGENGAMILPKCFDCGGRPSYPAKPKRAAAEYTEDEMNFLEGRCLGCSVE